MPIPPTTREIKAILVKEICKTSDGVVVGSSIVKIIKNNLNQNTMMLKNIEEFIKDLKSGTII